MTLRETSQNGHQWLSKCVYLLIVINRPVAMVKEQELGSWNRSNVLTEVPNERQPHVTCEVNRSYTTKARLVAWGFEDGSSQGGIIIVLADD